MRLGLRPGFFGGLLAPGRGTRAGGSNSPELADENDILADALPPAVAADGADGGRRGDGEVRSTRLGLSAGFFGAPPPSALGGGVRTNVGCAPALAPLPQEGNGDLDAAPRPHEGIGAAAPLPHDGMGEREAGPPPTPKALTGSRPTFGPRAPPNGLGGTRETSSASSPGAWMATFLERVRLNERCSTAASERVRVRAREEE